MNELVRTFLRSSLTGRTHADIAARFGVDTAHEIKEKAINKEDGFYREKYSGSFGEYFRYKAH